jgi:predicted RNA-binding Zn-ribbon protein involved in translation (DUF1610 family)
MRSVIVILAFMITATYLGASVPSWIQEGACVSVNVAKVDYSNGQVSKYGMRFTVLGTESNYIKVLYESSRGAKQVIYMDGDGNFVSNQGAAPNMFMFITDQEIGQAYNTGSMYVMGSSNRLIYYSSFYHSPTRVFLAAIGAFCDVAHPDAKSVTQCQKPGYSIVAVLVDTTAPINTYPDPEDAANTLTSETGFKTVPPDKTPELPCGDKSNTTPQPQPETSTSPEPSPNPPLPDNTWTSVHSQQQDSSTTATRRESRSDGNIDTRIVSVLLGAVIGTAVAAATYRRRASREQPRLYCPNCGYRLKGDEYVCPNCGYRLKQ